MGTEPEIPQSEDGTFCLETERRALPLYQEKFPIGSRVVFDEMGGIWSVLFGLTGVVLAHHDDCMWSFSVEIDRPDLIGDQQFYDEVQKKDIAVVHGSGLILYQSLSEEDKQKVNQGEGLSPYVPPDLDALYPDEDVQYSYLTLAELPNFFDPRDAEGTHYTEPEAGYLEAWEADPKNALLAMRYVQLIIHQGRGFKVSEMKIDLPDEPETYRRFHIPIAREFFGVGDASGMLLWLGRVPDQYRSQLAGYKGLLKRALIWTRKLPLPSEPGVASPFREGDDLPPSLLDPMRFLRHWALTGEAP